jgi:hypothetical protein
MATLFLMTVLLGLCLLVKHNPPGLADLALVEALAMVGHGHGDHDFDDPENDYFWDLF